MAIPFASRTCRIWSPAILDSCAVTNCSRSSLAEAAKAAVGEPQRMNVIADAGYSNGEQAEACEGKGILPHVPSNRAINNQGDGTFFDRTAFQYQEQSDTFVCPAGQTLTRKQLARKDRAVIYAAQPEVCGACALKGRCTARSRRFVTRHLHEAALQGMDQRATPEVTAAAAIDGGTSVCHVEVPHLRASAFPVARPSRSTNRDEPRGDGL